MNPVPRACPLVVAALFVPSLAAAHDTTDRADSTPTAGVSASLSTLWQRSDLGAGADDALDLGRAELTATVTSGAFELGGEVAAIRSAQPGSLLGLAGNSLVPVMRQAWIGGSWRPLPLHEIELGVDAGLLRTTVVSASAATPLRPLGESALERLGGVPRADVGLRLSAAWGTVATLQLDATSGEGDDDIDRNDGRTLGATLAAGLGEPGTTLGRLDLTVGIARGEVGPAELERTSTVAVLAWRERWVEAGATWARIDGVEGRAELSSTILSAWARVPDPWRVASLVAGWEQVAPDADADAAAVTATLGLRVDAPTDPDAWIKPGLLVTWSSVEVDDLAAGLPGAGEAESGDLYRVGLFAELAAP